MAEVVALQHINHYQHDLEHNFSVSMYVPALQEAPARFEPYFDPEKLVGKDRYIELLGSDVDQARHMQRTLILTEGFARQHNEKPGVEPITPDEIGLLRLAAITHDWGEAIVGDIPWPNKTAEDEITEEDCYRRIFHEILPGNLALCDALSEIIFNRDSRLGDIFRTIERIGYVMTGIRAARMCQDIDLSHEEAAQMGTMAAELKHNHSDFLRERAHRHPLGIIVVDQIAEVIAGGEDA